MHMALSTGDNAVRIFPDRHDPNGNKMSTDGRSHKARRAVAFLNKASFARHGRVGHAG
jgi:hypothetical protein